MVQKYSTVMRSMLLSKPPMVIFVVSLIAFAVTTFSLSVYVSKTEYITNPDVLSWNSLLVRISKLEFCLQPQQSANNSRPSNRTSFDETVSISVPISPKFFDEFRLSVSKFPAETFLVRGPIPMSKLGRHLARYEGQSIDLSFEISSGIDGTKANDNVCLILEGPKTLISDLNSGVSPENCSSDVLTRSNVTILNLASHSQDEVVALDWCDAATRNETPMILEFAEQPDWSVFVTTKDKEMMQLHLLVSSTNFSVLALVFFLICAFPGLFLDLFSFSLHIERVKLICLQW